MKDGMLLVNKPVKMTSRDVVNVICKKFNTRKVGHTGTLDPLATGLMILCINKATSLVELITSEDKEYIANVKLGIFTDTLDITGSILNTSNNYQLNYKELNTVLNSFLGTYMQEVPLYSAIKVKGKRLYDYARNNEYVPLPKREVTIKEIELLELLRDNFTFRVVVSKGTYIRSLIRDIGSKLGILMTMNTLKRTKIDNYCLDKAKNIDEISEKDIIPVENFLSFPKVIIDDDLIKKVVNGVRLPNEKNYENVMFLDKDGHLLAIYKKNLSNELCMYKLFNNN